MRHETPLRRRVEALEARRKVPANAGKPGFNEKGHKLLTADEIAEMQRLRAADPARWTQIALAKRYQCSRLMVGIHAPAPQRQAQHALVQQMLAERRLMKQPEYRRGRLRDYVARVTADEHADWHAKLARKRANAEAARVASEQRRAARDARLAKVVADRNERLRAQQVSRRAHTQQLLVEIEQRSAAAKAAVAAGNTAPFTMPSSLSPSTPTVVVTPAPTSAADVRAPPHRAPPAAQRRSAAQRLTSQERNKNNKK